MKSVIDVYSEIAKSNPPWTPEEETEFTKKWFKKNKSVFINEAMKHNMSLVFSLMNKVAFNKISEDVLQKAVIAMVDALRKYDPSKGVKISTWITNPICWGIQQAQSTYSKIGNISDELTSLNHRYNTKFSSVSIDSPIGNGDDSSETIANTITTGSVSANYVISRKMKSTSDEIRDNDIKVGVREMVVSLPKVLNKKEMVVVNGILSGLNLSEISCEMKLSRVRISQISKSAFDKIRRSGVGDKLKDLI